MLSYRLLNGQCSDGIYKHLHNVESCHPQYLYRKGGCARHELCKSRAACGA